MLPYSWPYSLALAASPLVALVSAVRYATVGFGHHQATLRRSVYRTVQYMVARWLGRWVRDGDTPPSEPLARVLARVADPFTRDVPGYNTPCAERARFLVHHARACRVLVYLHGGTYVYQMDARKTRAVMALWWGLEAGVRGATDVVALDYTLVPHGGVYPVQLDQLRALYAGLVRQGYTEIHLLGDSAGGHLALSYVRFMDPALPQPASLVLVSPWIDVCIRRTASVEAHKAVDNVDVDEVDPVLAVFAGEAWGEVNHGEVAEWGGVEAIANDRCLVTVGGSEVLWDQIQGFCRRLGVEAAVEPQGVHDTWALLETVGCRQPSEVWGEWGCARIGEFYRRVIQERDWSGSETGWSDPGAGLE